ENAGVAFTMGEEAARAPRLSAVIASEDLHLQSLDTAVLRERPGWDAALAATMGDLEASGIDAVRLRASGDKRCEDIAELRERLERLAPSSWTTPRVIAAATPQLEHDAKLWPFDGPSLFEITGHESVVLARF